MMEIFSGQLMTRSRALFLQSLPLEMFEKVLNMSLEPLKVF